MSEITSSTFIAGLRCPLCGAKYALDEVTYTCPACGPAGTLEMAYDYERLRETITPERISANTGPEHWTMWRYGPLLAVTNPESFPPLPVGWTPLVSAPRLAQKIGIRELWIKDDGRNPTASLKDRASAMVVARARQLGLTTVTTASSGNAAAALAGMCASAGIRAMIFVPYTAPQAKITQLMVYGATVFLVKGTYDDAFDLSVLAAREYGWYCRNTGMNPFTAEGKKTAALEVAEQLGWQAPDAFVVSVGDGNIIAGQYKGFADLHALGWIDRIPRMIGVQAQGSASLVHAWENNIPPEEMRIGPSDTIADSIAVGLPRDRVKAMHAVRATNGALVSVPDSALLAAIPDMARLAGVFAEPAASAALAGVYKARARGYLGPEDSVVLLNTGNGLKDINGAMRSLSYIPSEGRTDPHVGVSFNIPPTLDALRQIVG
jgi:threonine synthase